MKKLLWAAAATVIAFGTQANAADMRMPMKAPPPVAAAVFTWTGFYFGGHVGGAWSRNVTENSVGGFDDGALLSYVNDAAGVFGGLQLGYNVQSGNFVYGLEGDFGYIGIDRTLSGIGLGADDLVATKYSWYGTVTGRLGYAFGMNLLYVKGGLAVARITNTASDLDLGIDPFDFSETTRTRLGWTIGGGWEYAFSRNWSVKAEYLYMDFGKYTTPLNLDGETYTHRNSLHSGKIGVNYRF